MFVEIAGLPGSGKTTLYKALSKRLAELGNDVSDINVISQHRKDEGWIPRFVRAKPHRELLYRFSRFLVAHPRLISLSDKLFGEDDVKQFLFLLLCGHYQASVDLAKDDEMIFLEEGFLTHAVAACYDRNEDGVFDALVDALPAVDITIHLTTTPEVAYARVFERRGTQLGHGKMAAKFGDLAAFEARAALFERAVSRNKARGHVFLDVPADWDVDEVAKAVMDRAAQKSGAQAELNS